jgi:hypothetical protein
MARKRLTRQPTTDRTLTEPTQRRFAAMNACSPIVTQAEIHNLLVERGVKLSRTSVGFLLHGQWYNEDVARAFCDLTGTTLAAMWPEFLDERGKLLPTTRAASA